MLISIASGKGGTGKTLVATNLAVALHQQGTPVSYVDADVEAPNGHLFLKPFISDKTPVTISHPFLPSNACIGCGDCQAVCAFNAIVVIKKQVIVFNDLCHGCGACVLSCKDNLLSEQQRVVGHIKTGDASGIGFIEGILNMGEHRGTPIAGKLSSIASQRSSNGEIVIVDGPPGVSCGAVASVEDANLVVLVAEPTPLGLNDLKLVVEMCEVLKKPMVAVINKYNLGTSAINQFLSQKKIPVLMKIQFSREIADCGAQGELAVTKYPDMMKNMSTMATRLLINKRITQ